MSKANAMRTDADVLSAAADDAEDTIAPYYDVTRDGLFYVGTKMERGADRPVYAAPAWLCDPVEVLGNGHDEAVGEVCILRWRVSGTGKEVVRALPRSDIGEREGWRALQGGGLAVAPSRAARERLAYWLQRENRHLRYEVVTMTGWQHGAFVLPTGEIIGESRALMHFNGRPSNPAAYVPRGTLDGWRETVGRLARGNALPMAAIACALAGPLLPIAGESDGIGLHLYANTSSGKTTCGDVAASVWGEPQRTKTSWSGTALGHALNAEAANHRMLYLDEIGAGDAGRIGPALYLMLNGQSKAQGARDGGTVVSRSWLSMFLSTGEVAMSRYLTDGGMPPRGGQEIRMLDVPADGGAHRAFDCLHEFTTAAEFAEAFSAAAREHYGAPGRAFAEWLAPRWSEARERIGRERERMAAMVPEGAAPPVRRATRKFALLSAAVVLASHASLTGWTEDESRAAIDCVWKRWLDVFGTADRDDERLIEQAEGVLLSGEHSRFVLLSDAQNGAEAKAFNALGYKRYENGSRVVFLVYPLAFKREVIAGYDERHACEVLHQAGILDRPKKRRGFKVNCGRWVGYAYRMRPRRNGLEFGDEEE